MGGSTHSCPMAAWHAFVSLLLVLGLTAAAGAAIPLGGAMARRIPLGDGHFAKDVYHGVLAFGGGVLFAAVALVLVPDGVEHLRLGWSVLAFLAGTLFFVFVDAWVERRGGGAANIMATVLDYTPESLALGAAFATGGGSGPVLALLIGLQNLPEGFNSYRETTHAGMAPNKMMAILVGLVLLGPLAGGLGFTFLGGRPGIVGAVTLFASGGILFGIFHDLAPKAARNCHYAPTSGASLGFLVGLVGHMLLG